MNADDNRPTLETLYRKYAGVVLRRVRRFYRDPEEAEEVLHEVFLRVADKLDTFQGGSSPVTWLYQVATRFCLNRLRNDGRRRELLDQNGADLFWSNPVSEPAQEWTALLRSLWRVIDEDLMEIAVYYHLDGMTHAEIARVLGCSRRTVGNRLAELEALATDMGGRA